MSERTKLTKRSIDRIQAPAKGRRFVYDTEQRGLVLIVTANDHRALYLYAKDRGKPTKRKLGNVGDITLEQARNRVREYIGSIAKGEGVEAVQADTLGQVRDHYLKHYAPTRLTPKTLVSDESLWNTRLAHLSGRKLTHITDETLAALHADIGKKHKRTANRAVQYVRRLYKHAVKRMLYRGPMPTERIDLYPEVKRERFLSDDEVKRFVAAVEAEGQPFTDFFMMLLFTGARLDNVRTMAWADIDLRAKRWTIPHDQAKEKQAITIPLSPQSLAILQRRHGDKDGHPYVFPPLRDKGKSKYLSQPQRPFDRIRTRAGLKDFRIHDIRHSVGSMLANAGVADAVIGASLGHRDRRSTARYTHAKADSVRAAMDEAAAAFDAAGKGNDDGEI